VQTLLQKLALLETVHVHLFLILQYNLLVMWKISHLSYFKFFDSFVYAYVPNEIYKKLNSKICKHMFVDCR
jgi:hypothetical protein